MIIMAVPSRTPTTAMRSEDPLPMPKTPATDGAPDVPGDASDGADELTGLSYEQAREELIAVVQRLESGGAPLAESLELWERGEKLAAICQQWLDGAKAKVEAARAQRENEG
jgi:exodeoxyribonuclease VII small subunit